jgi:hypothetical protein
MANTANQRKALATAYGTAAPYGALFQSTGPGNTGAATNEISGGSYARVAIVWNAATDNGTVASTVGNAVAYNVNAGTTVTYWGCCVSSTATTADVRDSVAITSQAFASSGTYTITPTYTQT